MNTYQVTIEETKIFTAEVKAKNAEDSIKKILSNEGKLINTKWLPPKVKPPQRIR